ncbi:MAG: ADP-glyceromanno-heptose 6-epimerase [Ignavibacteria bacterium CG_4_8_14_3_um_filter_37_9]|nr:ADP-glyceromanno-heptose 6-epimerase [Ignavibacteria bacterium]OIO16696.1 MAG: ADP-glyceromanno-heptose 6-epimerase [Ignavibacteria bacterium CG1_02_37_35]PIS45138.1 MAG: ADP-glyceromanno-heptose 6-epimerase [Ignavibacteria bacterium CG08_land_8_20_14_0_20_37_9]PIX00399.1 MAG: ADP-glyceromanno-heptose 6-epimerase [Ignavibacteria bacterium CG_4_8_14_3_um_filter_37_9]PIX94091.1 MAG: ADP-glyceromanno-heptose 6-epimerase [Ignavibacteria bacterium CG_4_10_14_3_um_filter_37_18]
MIVVTGGAGFIGSALVWRLNQLGKKNIIIVDRLGSDEKWKNLVALHYADYFDKIEFIEKIVNDEIDFEIEAIIHMGANSATTEKDADHLMENNYKYTQALAKYCLEKDIRFIYASSAATYGDGSLGFDDANKNCLKLHPLNMYGYSKNIFDVYAFNNGMMDEIVGIKYFNVFGPNESHKGDMRSVVHKAFEQVRDYGKVKLFKSLHPDYKDGEQKRDFIYVKDAVEMTLFFLEHKDKNGLYNVGGGKARTWKDLVTALFHAVGKPVNIEYIEMPEQLAEKYQYFTEANLEKIKKAGYLNPLYSLEEGITDYVKNYLMKRKFLGEE